MEIAFVKPQVMLVDPVPEGKVVNTLAVAARTCYGKTENLYADAEKLITSIYRRAHWSVFEHAHIQARILCDRGVSHELVRHRIGVSFLQESTRYVKYKNTIRFVYPWWWEDDDERYNPQRQVFEGACRTAAVTYECMINAGASPQAARAVLPNALATNIFVTANIREVFHILRLRLDSAAHPDMRCVMQLFHDKLVEHYPFLFKDLFLYEV